MTHISTSVSAAEQAARAFAARSHGAFIDGAFEAAAGERLAASKRRSGNGKAIFVTPILRRRRRNRTRAGH